tara:strand:+ start:590 stop:1012 length:423 start_codon:yes stop_codon:yes gene_type:complete
MKDKYYAIFGIILVLMLVHIEFILNEDIAPENILINVETPQGNAEENAECFADITSSVINEENKPLDNLESIYDFVDPKIYYVPEEKGFYLLNTEFNNYKGEFEIRVVCYSPSFSGVSYTIINNTNNNCEVKQKGKFVVC